MTAELEFYRNRNKELEGVVGRTEKRFKEAEQTYIEDNEKYIAGDIGYEGKPRPTDR